MKLPKFCLPEWQITAGETKVRTLTFEEAEDKVLTNFGVSSGEFVVYRFDNPTLLPIVDRDVRVSYDSSASRYFCDLTLKPEDTEGRCGKFIYLLILKGRGNEIVKLTGILYIADGGISGYDITGEFVDQAMPVITISESGIIYATATQKGGYVKAGTKTATSALDTLNAQTIVPTTSDQVIPKGKYLIGDQTVKGDANLLAENIREGISLFGVEGVLPVYEEVEQATPSIIISNTGLITAVAEQESGYVREGTKRSTLRLDTVGAQTITPGTEDVVIPDKVYLTGQQTILGDPDLLAENIKKGVNIFGVTGTVVEMQGEIRSASDITVDGPTVHIPSGNYLDDVTKSVKTAEQATPVVSIDSSGLITAVANQREGYVNAGSKTSTKQLQVRDALTKSGKYVVALPGYYPARIEIEIDQGIDTSDATASADKIFKGFTAYVKGVKITGTYEPPSDPFIEWDEHSTLYFHPIILMDFDEVVELDETIDHIEWDNRNTLYFHHIILADFDETIELDDIEVIAE